MAIGAVSFVLHAHIPYCRRAGRWPHGEEWLFEAMAESYIPLLNALNNLVEAGLRPRLTLGLTPVLCEQLADEEIQGRFESYLDERAHAAGADVGRGGSAGGPPPALAARYCHEYLAAARDFAGRYGRDLVAAFRSLADRGVIELVGGMATHCYTPLLSRDSSIRAQLRTGLETIRRHFGATRRALWLPECAYRPAFPDPATGVRRPGLDEFLEAEGIGLIFSEAAALAGPGGAPDPYQAAEAARSAFLPQRIAGSTVAVIARNPHSSALVWSADQGYPGDGSYREFHKHDATSGHRYWRVTDRSLGLESKEPYDPEAAAARVAEHARDFVATAEAMLQRFHRSTGLSGLVSSHFDAELFGHWWYEGIDWLKHVLANLAMRTTVRLMSAGDFLEAHPPTSGGVLREGSWGWKGGHTTWLNRDTEWLWERLHESELVMEKAVTASGDCNDADRTIVLQQMARELLLLQSSDWPFLISTGSAHDYARRRFHEHCACFDQLRESLESDLPREARLLAERFQANHNPFPSIDWRLFGGRGDLVAPSSDR
jgi:1,4-alpha-glucan branching enzyme